jgi:2',3'-cyclic-nucleotide 2'-phosphodiesterase (5'-nucleotidase family)
MNMSRRIFLKQSARVGGALMAASMLPKFGFAHKEAGTITILHTNDIHGYLDPLPPDAGRFAGLGGAAARAALIKQIREEQPFNEAKLSDLTILENSRSSGSNALDSVTRCHENDDETDISKENQKKYRED